MVRNRLMRVRVGRKRLLRFAIFSVCLAFFGQLACGSVQLSLTSDEPPHFVHGYVMLTTGDTWALLDHRHPPLLNAWGAWPLLLQPERPDPRAMAHWGSDFILFVRELWPQLGPVDRLAFVTRYPNMLVGVLLLALVFRWARERFGLAAGWLAVTVMAFDPTMVAHAQLNTTDLGMAFFAFACLYLVLGITTPSWWRLVGIGVTLGATMASKGSGVMLVPVVIALIGWEAIQFGRKGAQGRGEHPVIHFFFSAACIGGVAVLLLWASYGFRLEPLSPDSAARLPLISHIEMVRAILAEKSRTAFLWGGVREGGWWWYFPAAFAIKTPIPILIFIVWALFNAIIKVAHRTSHITNQKLEVNPLAFWLFPAFYLAVAIRSGMNIGYRHLLPVLPFVYVGIGWIRDARHETRTAKHETRFMLYARRFTLVVLLAWMIVGTFRVYPFSIAYFNALVGGPRNGYRYLVDSNVDWGQSFKALKTWMDETGTDEVRLSYYTWIDPVAYGVNYRPLPPAKDAGPVFDRRYDPEPGVYAISATPLQGVMIADSDMYDWFRHREPVAQPGYGLLVYEVEPHPSKPQWLAQCAVPVVPLTPEAIATGFGRSDFRIVPFDCTQSWIYPKGGASPGWYALHSEMAHAEDDAFLPARLASAHVRYEQHKPGLLPPFVLYEWDTHALTPTVSLETSVEMGALTLIGYDVMSERSLSPGTTFAMATWWQIEAIPERSLSLMLHLVGPDGAPVIVGDGLGVPREVWQVGDVIVQRHTLSIPADAPAGAYTPRVGVYWLDTMERWSLQSGPQAGADSAALPPVMVK